MAGVLQSVIVKKTRAKTLAIAMRVARRYAQRMYTHRETGTSFRFRQRPPSLFSRMWTEHPARGIALIKGTLRRKLGVNNIE